MPLQILPRLFQACFCGEIPAWPRCSAAPPGRSAVPDATIGRNWERQRKNLLRQKGAEECGSASAAQDTAIHSQSAETYDSGHSSHQGSSAHHQATPCPGIALLRPVLFSLLIERWRCGTALPWLLA